MTFDRQEKNTLIAIFQLVCQQQKQCNKIISVTETCQYCKI